MNEIHYIPDRDLDGKWWNQNFLIIPGMKYEIEGLEPMRVALNLKTKKLWFNSMGENTWTLIK